MSFGFQLETNSNLSNDILEWQFVSSPSVDLFVHSKLACPFFVFELQSNAGQIRTAENQVGNALIMMHDILCSLELNNTLHLFALIQSGFSVVPYISFSKQAIDDEGKTYCKTVSHLHREMFL